MKSILVMIFNELDISRILVCQYVIYIKLTMRYFTFFFLGPEPLKSVFNSYSAFGQMGHTFHVLWTQVASDCCAGKQVQPSLPGPDCPLKALQPTRRCVLNPSCTYVYCRPGKCPLCDSTVLFILTPEPARMFPHSEEGTWPVGPSIPEGDSRDCLLSPG